MFTTIQPFPASCLSDAWTPVEETGKHNSLPDSKSIKQEFPDVAVLMLTDNTNDSYVIDAIHAGAEGYILFKDISPEMLLQSVHRAVEGDVQIDTEVLRAEVGNLLRNGRKTPAERTTEAAHLTERELDVLKLMGNGDIERVLQST